MTHSHLSNFAALVLLGLTQVGSLTATAQDSDGSCVSSDVLSQFDNSLEQLALGVAASNDTDDFPF